MDRDIVEQNARLVLRSENVPPKVVALADSLSLQSTTRISLKPNQEPARIHICCALAVEKLGTRLDLPLPDTQRPPIPPAQYIKLLNQFRSVLIPESCEPKTPTKRKTPAASTLKRTPRAARSKAVNYLKDEVDGDFGGDEEEEAIVDLRLAQDEEDEDEIRFSTPRKRPPSGPRLESPSPKKSPRKKISGPQLKDIEALAVRMGLERRTIDAVLQAFSQFCDLVKDSWGLAYGLLCVISDRAEPVVGQEHERRLIRGMGELVPMVHVDRDEWINWVDKIVTGQTWIMNISSKSEPQPTLIGAPGGWGMGVEFKLVEQ